MNPHLRWLSIFFTSLLLCRAEVDWPQLQYSLVASNLASPVHIAHADDGSGRLYIVEQAGTIRIWNGSNLETNYFLDVRNKVLTSSERGLLSVAFPSGYSSNRHFYVYYTRKPDGAVTLSRFSLLPGQEAGDTNSEQVLLTAPHPNSIHNGGQMTFGPDGYLYLAIGDGGYGSVRTNPAQRLDLLLGKILRIDSENGNPYSIPPTNPFATNAAARPEIWAYGFRNPWRFSFDRQTGDLYIADVGEKFREEIDFQPAGSAGGQNYGWPIYEGNLFNSTNFPSIPTNSLTYPVAVYSDPFNSSVIGGYVYQRTNFSRFSGVYFYADFMEQRIYGMKFDEGQWKTAMLGTHPRMSAFGEDEAGNLYLLDYYGGKLNLVQDNGVAARPTFDPPSGNSWTELITLNSLTPNSIIRYTTENRNPTESDLGLSPGNSVAVTNGTTLRAQTFRADLLPSMVSTGSFNLIVGTPQFNGVASNTLFSSIFSNTVMTITSLTAGAQIHYTTNGLVPTTNDALYTGPFILNPSRLMARGFRLGFSNSPVRNVLFHPIFVATPVFSPTAGPITNGTIITITCATPGAQIFYTLDGTDPATNSISYSGPFPIEGNTTVKAAALKPDYATSSRTTFYNRVTVTTPEFLPSSGPITNETFMVINCSTPSNTVYYTLDGSDPTTNSQTYAGPFSMDGNTTLSARGFSPGFDPSAIARTFFPLQTVATPLFTPAQGPVTNGTLLEISCATSGATIRYTLDGTDPVGSSAVYAMPLSLAGNQTVKARAFLLRYGDSAVQSVNYDLWIPEKTVVTTIAGNGQAGFSDGMAIEASFNSPEGLCVDNVGNVYVTDFGNHSIRRIATNGVVTTLAGNGVAGYQNGSGTNAQFNKPVGICFGVGGDLFIADRENRRIRRMTLAGEVSTFAGTGATGQDDGPPAAATFGFLTHLATDSTLNMYTGQAHAIRKIATNGQVTTVPNAGGFVPYDATAAIDLDTNLFIVSSYIIVSKSIPGVGEEIYAGGSVGFADGPRLSAKFPQVPFVTRSIVRDSARNLYISDPTRIRKINLAGQVSTYAGTAAGGYRNGSGATAYFNQASGLAVDPMGNIYVADTGNHCIRRISADMDSDEIPDFEETAGSGFDPAIDDRNVDSDSDGVSNADEYIAGTNPLSPTSRFQIKGVNRSGNNLDIAWNAAANRIYEISSSTNLLDWNVVTNIPIGLAGETSVVLTNGAASASQSFYRLRVSLP